MQEHEHQESQGLRRYRQPEDLNPASFELESSHMLEVKLNGRVWAKAGRVDLINGNGILAYEDSLASELKFSGNG